MGMTVLARCLWHRMDRCADRDDTAAGLESADAARARVQRRIRA